MKKELTAVTWFYKTLVKGKLTGKDSIEFLYHTARCMESEQLTDAWENGYVNGVTGQDSITDGEHNSTIYFNDTFITNKD